MWYDISCMHYAGVTLFCWRLYESSSKVYTVDFSNGALSFFKTNNSRAKATYARQPQAQYKQAVNLFHRSKQYVVFCIHLSGVGISDLTLEKKSEFKWALTYLLNF